MQPTDIIDKRCKCGHKKSVHRDNHQLGTHNTRCLLCKCQEYTYASNVLRNEHKTTIYEELIKNKETGGDNA